MLLMPFLAPSQNLVPNAAFEHHEGCPGANDHYSLRFVDSWSAPDWQDSSGYSFTHSPDFFHACAKEKFGQPGNFLGTQAPAAGNGYAERNRHRN